MRAVAAVIVKRQSVGKWWGRSASEVCLRPYQFRCWDVSSPSIFQVRSVSADIETFRQALSIAEMALDPERGISPRSQSGRDPLPSPVGRSRSRLGAGPGAVRHGRRAVFLQQYRLTRRSGIMDNVALDVIIGLVFIYLLFSILLTSFSELVFNNFLGLRGKNLDVALKSAFGASASRLIGGDSSADGLVKDFFQNGLVSSLFMNGRTPSELPPDLFAKAYLAVLGNFSGPTDRPSTPAEFLNKLRKNTALSNHQKIVGVLDPLLAGSETSWGGL
jgi:hypothetical protein